MNDPAVIAKQLADLARKHIEDQQCRIIRQRELMAKYERDKDAARLSVARHVLEKMQKQLAQMTAAHVAAEEHLSRCRNGPCSERAIDVAVLR
jgi:hypothetical protein